MHAKFGDDQCRQTTLPALGHITDTHLLRKRLRSFCEDVINFWHEVRSTSNNHHVPFRSDMSRSSKTPPISMVDQDLRECCDPSQAAAGAILFFFRQLRALNRYRVIGRLYCGRPNAWSRDSEL